MNAKTDVMHYLTIGLTADKADYSFNVAYKDTSEKWVTRERQKDDISIIVLSDNDDQSIASDLVNETEYTFPRIVDAKDSSDLGTSIKFTVIDKNGQPVNDIHCNVKNRIRIQIPGNMFPVVKSTFYHLSVRAKSSTDGGEPCFLATEFSAADGGNSSRVRMVKKEILSGSRTVFVLCDGQAKLPRVNSGYDNGSGTFLQIIDPDTLVNLGTTLKCSAVDENGEDISGGQCVVTQFEEINPPQWIPLPNDKSKSLEIKSDRLFSVCITDRKLGTISYSAKSVKVDGVDVRVYGNEITYGDDGRIDVSPLNEGTGQKFWMSIKGSHLGVENVRTSDVVEIQIDARSALDVVAGSGEKESEESGRWDKDRNWMRDKICIPLWRIKFIVGSVCLLVAMTLYPVKRFNVLCEEYIKLIRVADDNTNPALSLQGSFVPLTNTLSVATSYEMAKTNVVVNSASSVASQAQSKSAIERPTGSGGVTFCFTIVCLLYVVLYVLVVFGVVQAFRSIKRDRKLHGNMQSVIDALRNERDKEKRRAMQKKILDDMIDTYLDRPSADE